MRRKLSLLSIVPLILLMLMGGTAKAQDARAVLQAAVKSMGTDSLKCITYSGTGGYVGIVGQGYAPGDDWPKVELANFSRTINFDARAMREEQVRRQGNYPQRGGGGIPLQGEQRQISLVNGNYAWNLQGTNVNPQPAAAQTRQLEIWLDPHGFLKGAMAAKDLVSFEAMRAVPPVTAVSERRGRSSLIQWASSGSRDPSMIGMKSCAFRPSFRRHCLEIPSRKRPMEPTSSSAV